jgi:DNA-binding ferritin-like protein
VAAQAQEYADEIAERAVALGGGGARHPPSGFRAVSAPRIPHRGR